MPLVAASPVKVGFHEKANVPEFGPQSQDLAAQIPETLKRLSVDPDKIAEAEAPIAAFINHSIEHRDKTVFAAGEEEGRTTSSSSGKSNTVLWSTAAGLTGAAATALIVWAIMHNHDKKLMAKLAAANSQGN